MKTPISASRIWNESKYVNPKNEEEKACARVEVSLVLIESDEKYAVLESSVS